ncbi:hypothetical protein BC629DRAFT_1076343 [Irpex lacteus]|nr:hypothetical protein BC629DRAFT_1076343 [Irpex lacteus]
MAPALELLRAVASDRYKAEGIEASREALDILNKTDGHIASYIGTEVQDPSKWYGIILWETVGHHKALVDNKEVYPGLVKSIGESAAKLEFVQHTILSTSTPEDALNAPITEIVFWTLKEGTDKEEFKGIISAFIGKILASDAVKNRGGWGTIVEDERKFTVILGWNSKEEFDQTVASAPPTFAETLGKLKTLADLELKHVVLKKH